MTKNFNLVDRAILTSVWHLEREYTEKLDGYFLGKTTLDTLLANMFYEQSSEGYWRDVVEIVSKNTITGNEFFRTFEVKFLNMSESSPLPNESDQLVLSFRIIDNAFCHIPHTRHLNIMLVRPLPHRDSPSLQKVLTSLEILPEIDFKKTEQQTIPTDYLYFPARKVSK